MFTGYRFGNNLMNIVPSSELKTLNGHAIS